MNQIKILEKKIISKKNRFEISSLQRKELSRRLNKSIVLIIGASGSIGSEFSKNIVQYNYKKIYFIDKDENSLTDLNRTINLYKSKKKEEYICNDFSKMNLNKFIKEKKITHIFNFAALKHVRSEEEFFSCINMIKTNCIDPFKLGNLNKTNVKLIFYISSDKAVNPLSILGFTKKIMENNLAILKDKYCNIFVSTVRFANVSFSNGSILKSVIEKIKNKQIIGIPKNIQRYFITHDEAASLCFKAILNENNGFICIPNPKLLEMKKISNLTYEILSYFGIRNSSKIKFSSKNIMGQKDHEKMQDEIENAEFFKNDKSVKKIQLKIKKKLSKFNLPKINKNLNTLKKHCYKFYLKKNELKSIAKRFNIKDVI